MHHNADPEVGQAGVQTGGSSALIVTNLFETKQIRHNFIKKVYSLLTIQLIITTAIVALFSLHDDIHLWARKNLWFQMASFGVAFAVLIAITCMDKLRRKHPYNLVILFVFTLAESLMLAAFTVMFNTKSIMIAATTTVAICLALTIFAMQTRYDFTPKIGIMLVILMVISTISIIFLFFRPSENYVLVMSAIMAIMMGIFLVIDTQMIIGGTHSVQMSPEEYILATISLYMDVINMFIYILALLGRE